MTNMIVDHSCKLLIPMLKSNQTKQTHMYVKNQTLVQSTRYSPVEPK